MNPQNTQKIQPLLEVLYPSGGVDLRGVEFLGARAGLESALQSVFPSGRLRVYAQTGEDGLEEATHFSWLGLCGELGYELEVMQSGDCSRVVVHRVMSPEDCASELGAGVKNFMGGV